MNSVLETHKDESLLVVLDKAYEVYYFVIYSFIFLDFFSPHFLYQLMALAPHIPIERCRLVKYNYIKEVMDQSFDLDEVHFIYLIVIIVNLKFSFSIKLLGSFLAGLEFIIYLDYF